MQLAKAVVLAHARIAVPVHVRIAVKMAVKEAAKDKIAQMRKKLAVGPMGTIVVVKS